MKLTLFICVIKIIQNAIFSNTVFVGRVSPDGKFSLFKVIRFYNKTSGFLSQDNLLILRAGEQNPDMCVTQSKAVKCVQGQEMTLCDTLTS